MEFTSITEQIKVLYYIHFELLDTVAILDVTSPAKATEFSKLNKIII